VAAGKRREVMADKKRLVSEDHDLVFHYTTQEGLRGILETQTLRATHYKYLNDQSELCAVAPRLQVELKPHVLSFAHDLAKRNAEFKAQIVDTGQLESFVDSEVETMIGTLQNVTLGEERQRKFFQPFILAFCSHTDDYERANGLLSQWRGYGGEVGYALVFDTKGLEQLFQSEGDRYFYSSGFFGDVVYDGDDEKFKEEFSDLPGMIWNKMQAILLQQEEPKDELFSRFIHALSRFKHRGFREEQEVRAIFSPMAEDDVREFEAADPKEYAKVKHRQVKQPDYREGFVPYIELSHGANVRLPINRIIVGPHADKELRKARLDRYLEMNSVEIETTVSETPLI
jgi:Protein of unknown function (DUF2971)